MATPLSAVRSPVSMSMRLLLFGLAAGMGTLVGYGWSLEVSDLVYDALLQAFVDPGFTLASLAVAVTLGFTLGFAHVFRICYLPAVLAVVPLLQAARDKHDWLRTAALLILSMVLVTAVWGAIVGAPATALAGTVGSRRTMGLIMQPVLMGVGLLLVIIGMGELGLIRRLLPDFHLPGRLATHGESHRYRQVLILGVSMAATFGIICNRPLYLVLLVYVAIVGGVGAGALALGAYGLGLSLSIVLAGLALLPAGRSERLVGWLAERQEAFRIVQGLAFVGMGALSVSWFLLRYVPPPN